MLIQHLPNDLNRYFNWRADVSANIWTVSDFTTVKRQIKPTLWIQWTTSERPIVHYRNYLQHWVYERRENWKTCRRLKKVNAINAGIGVGVITARGDAVNGVFYEYLMILHARSFNIFLYNGLVMNWIQNTDMVGGKFVLRKKKKNQVFI